MKRHDTDYVDRATQRCRYCGAQVKDNGACVGGHLFAALPAATAERLLEIVRASNDRDAISAINHYIARQTHTTVLLTEDEG